jgi:hypothetical protein
MRRDLVGERFSEEGWECWNKLRSWKKRWNKMEWKLEIKR